jgi:hypothetical protein
MVVIEAVTVTAVTGLGSWISAPPPPPQAETEAAMSRMSERAGSVTKIAP